MAIEPRRIIGQNFDIYFGFFFVQVINYILLLLRGTCIYDVRTWILYYVDDESYTDRCCIIILLYSIGSQRMLIGGQSHADL